MARRRKQQRLDPIAIAQAQRVHEQQEVQAAFLKGVTALRDFIAQRPLEHHLGVWVPACHN